MGNMSYCRFENTLSDLEDCYEDMEFGKDFSELSLTEQEARNELVALCKKIAEQFDEELIENVVNAGSVLIGNFTPESAGDYASGTNHTLPTNGYARQYSGVSLDSFVKKITYQEITKQGLQNIGPIIELMAEAEQLDAHKQAVSIRLQTLNK